MKSSYNLKPYYDGSENFEIGIDEAGRGPLFGPVVAAAVILPKDDKFDHFKMKDSKKFYSKKKIVEISNYIKENALYWSVSFQNEKVIDELNILQATQKAMHECIKDVVFKSQSSNKKYNLLIDGNYFNPISVKINGSLAYLPFELIKGGDNLYTSIAAASIIAKVERDKYIEELCSANPELNERYSISKNKGYGAKNHLEGIKSYGISEWHRKSFGICKLYC